MVWHKQDGATLFFLSVILLSIFLLVSCVSSDTQWLVQHHYYPKLTLSFCFSSTSGRKTFSQLINTYTLQIVIDACAQDEEIFWEKVVSL
jgi:hypothetical protein